MYTFINCWLSQCMQECGTAEHTRMKPFPRKNKLNLKNLTQTYDRPCNQCFIKLGVVVQTHTRQEYASCDCPYVQNSKPYCISPLLLSLFCRSFDVYGFCHSQHDSLQGDEDLLRIRVRKNELQAHRVQDVGLHVFLRDSSAVCRYCPYCRGTSLHEYFNIFHWYLKE